MLRVFFLLTLDKSRVPTEETAHAKPRGDLERAAPRRSSSYCWLYAPSGVGDARHRRGLTAGTPRPAAPARSSGPRRRLRSARSRPRRKAGSAGRLRAHRRACSARTDARAPHAPTRALRAHRRACSVRTDAHTPRAPARLPGASLDAQTSASSGAQLARPATCTRRVSRRVLGASRGAQPARLCGVRSVCILNRSVLTLVLLLWCISGWVTFVPNHTEDRSGGARSDLYVLLVEILSFK